MRDASAVGDAVGGIVTFASDLGPALVGLACALAALLLLLFLCLRTRLRRQQQRQCAPPLLADNVSEAQRSRLLELQFYMRSCMDYRALRLLPHVGAHEESAMALVTTADSDDERQEASSGSDGWREGQGPEEQGHGQEQ